MKCSHVSELMMKYFDGEMNDLDAHQLKQHIKNCAVCGQEYESMKEAIAYMEQPPLLDPPGDFEVCVMDAIKTEAAQEKDYISAPIKFMMVCVAFGMLMLTGWMVIIFHNISITDLVSTTMRYGFTAEVFSNIIDRFYNGYKMMIVLGESVFGVYSLLLRSYYDVIFSMAAVLIIIYSMVERMLKHQY